MSDENETMEELEIEVETEGDEPEAEALPEPQQAESSDNGDDELASYSKNVQSRIKKLTEKYRQEERDKAEAVRLSQQLLEENKKLKSRVQNLDTGYLNEYGNRLESQEAAAKQLYREAYESGDPDKILEAQQTLSRIAVERDKYDAAKKKADLQKRLETSRAKQDQGNQQPQQPVQQPQAAPVQPDPRAQKWAERNSWFGEDRVMTTAAFAIHSQLVEEEGFDPQSDEYYTEIDNRIRREFPHKFETANKKSGGGSRVASAGNSASRSTSKQGRRSVKLTHSQVAIAKKLGVPLEEYAKFVKE